MNLQSISRYISLILRHKPEVIGITIDEHGWANVEELIQGIAKNNPGFNKEMKLYRLTISSDILSMMTRH